MNETAHPQPQAHPARWRLAMWALIAAALLAPLVAMQFTAQVAWSAADFALAAALLIGAGAVFEAAARLIRSPAYRIAVGVLLLVAVALVWADGAVGVF